MSDMNTDQNAKPQDEKPVEAAAEKPAEAPKQEAAPVVVHETSKDAPKDAPKDGEHKKDDKKSNWNRTHVLAAICYLGILFLVPLLMEEKDEFIQFHIRQGIVLFALSVISSISLLSHGPAELLSLAVFVISVYGAYRAWKGERWVLPLVGHLAERIKL